MIILAVDFGDARTGLAICDKGEMLASPLGVIHEHNFEKTAQKVANTINEKHPEIVVVGHPINMNGTIGERADKCRAFKELLETLIDVPAVLWDERCTTITAHNILNVTDTRGKKRKEVIDAVAATIILDNYMLYRKNHQEE